MSDKGSEPLAAAEPRSYDEKFADFIVEARKRIGASSDRVSFTTDTLMLAFFLHELTLEVGALRQAIQERS